MCQQIKEVVNKYTGARLYVSCGHCPACQQEKAAKRATRIRNNASLGTIALFITLTYDRLSCPVVFREDLHKRKDTLTVYRLCDFRRVRTDNQYNMAFKRNYRLTKIGLFHDCVYPDSLQDSDLPKLTHLNSKYVGVPYYKDAQDFYKRLRYYIDYHYGKDIKYSYFHTSELGETTYRPHHHALLFIPSDMYEQFKCAVLACWPFADRRRSSRYIQVAKDAASYVASYVNSDADFPDLYKTSTFKAKHSMSKHFGVGLECFSLGKILEKTSQGSLTYNAVTHKNGVAEIRVCSIPKYVINRFFPIYKGYSYRSDSENRQFISRPDKFAKVPPKDLGDLINLQLEVKKPLVYGTPKTKRNGFIFEHVRPDGRLIKVPFRYKGVSLDKIYGKYNFRNILDIEQARKVAISLDNAFEYYHAITGRSRLDYAIDFVNTWNCYRSTCYRLFMEDAAQTNFVDAYDNLKDYVTGNVRSLSLDDYPLQITSLDPNLMHRNVEKHMRLLQTYELKKKTRKVVNYCMARCGHYV